jgi:glutamate/aspartate transport system substrate-binding protein
MIRKDDPKFKQVVDSAVSALLTSGAINGIYNTWFEKPIAPKGINLSIPISPSLKRVMAKPTDSPDPKVYE